MVRPTANTTASPRPSPPRANTVELFITACTPPALPCTTIICPLPPANCAYVRDDTKQLSSTMNKHGMYLDPQYILPALAIDFMVVSFFGFTC
jgi:hypothetical protein